jgi:hypothetical protein
MVITVLGSIVAASAATLILYNRAEKANPIGLAAGIASGNRVINVVVGFASAWTIIVGALQGITRFRHGGFNSLIMGGGNRPLMGLGQQGMSAEESRSVDADAA